MKILGIDPGPTQSAYVIWDDGVLVEKAVVDNNELLAILWCRAHDGIVDRMAIEMIACYGMAVGAETFETCVWIGRFMQMWLESSDRDSTSIIRIPRLHIKVNLCKSAKAKDANVRQALIDRLGPVGTKKQPGPLFGVSSHMWAALAVAVTCADRLQIERETI